MATVHAGSWFGLPDFGATEWAANLLSGGKTTDLSQAIAPSPQAASTVNNPAPAPAVPTTNPTNPIVTPKTVTTQTPTQTTSNPTSSGDTGNLQDQVMQQINDLYNQNNSLFGQQESNLSGQADLAKQNIQTQGDQASREYQSALDQALKMAQEQQGTLAQTTSSAKSENARNYSALLQSVQSKFGAGSAGLALSEIIGGEFARNSGNILNGYTSALQKVFDFAENSQKTFQLAKTKLSEDVAMKMAAVDQSFKDGLLQIATNRSANEQAKSAAKVQLLQETYQNAQAINNYKIEAQVQLETWLAQEKQTAQDNLSYAQQLATQAGQNTFAGQSQIANSTGYAQTTSPSTPATSLQYVPGMGYLSKDQIDQLQNPWTN